MSLDMERDTLDTPSTPRASTIQNPPETPQKSVTGAPPVQDVELRTRLDRVLHSDIGINTLLTRLKQSISSAREFSGFLRERAALEEKHFNGLQRLSRSTHDLLGRPENRQGSFAFNYQEIGVMHSWMAKNSEEFTNKLMAMSEEIQEVAAHCERGRKQWKHTGLEAEQKAQEADNVMEKARQRYFSLAEQYDRVRTGERQGGKFGLKGPKSAAQQEESLLSKAENADQEYRSRVETAQAQRHELQNSSRPQAIRELQNLIMECDAAVSMQLQKFAVLNEKLLLGNGLCISPLKTQDTSAATGTRSLRDIVQAINNQKDLEDFVLSHGSKVGPTPTEIRYEKHPVFAQNQQAPQSHAFAGPPRTDTGFSMGPRADTGFGMPQRNDTGFGMPQRNDTGFGMPQRNDTGFGMPQRNDTGFGMSQRQDTGFGGPPRADTGFGGTTGPGNPSGQTTGVVSNHPGSQHNLYHGSQATTSSNAPQLPQIGSLSQGNRASLEGSRTGPQANRNEGDNRNYSGLSQQRFSQSSYPGHAGLTPGTTFNQQVTNDGAMAARAGRGQNQPSDGAGRDQGPAVSGMGRGRAPDAPNSFISGSSGGPSAPGLYSPGERATQYSQANDPRQNERATQQGSSYQPPPDGRGLPGQTDQFGPSAGRANNNAVPVLGGASIGRGPAGRPNLPPLRPVFGVPLDELFRRDGSAVPAIVYQCVQAVDLFGLNTEGIYRVSGSAQHIMELQTLFDHDSSQVDFRSRSAFYNDINSVTTLLKHFLRDLPDPLLTSAQYNSFIQAAKIDEDIIRRDSLHAIINSLPDPNYATLRTLVLHLNRVASNSAQNRMTASNIAIIFGPTLMGSHANGPGGEFRDSGWQARVVETILNNTLQIFDDDD